MKQRIRLLLLTACCTCLLPLFSNAWGFYAHKRINRVAVFLLPEDMLGFYKKHIDFLTENAVRPDKRRFSDPEEAPRHYIDLDHYGSYPFDSLPRRWSDAVTQFSEDTLKAHGIVPWHLQLMMFRLEKAFRERNARSVLFLSSDIGHYIADANVPLHTTENYNGQLTDQVGIHAFWESRLPELFGDDYDYLIGKAAFMERPLERFWSAVLESHLLVDSVLLIEKRLSQNFPEDKQKTFEKRGETMIMQVFSEEYSAAYNKAMDGMVERRMRSSIKLVADAWYTCWLNAGQPDLTKMEEQPPTPEELEEFKKEEQAWKEKRQRYGHEHPETGNDGVK